VIGADPLMSQRKMFGGLCFMASGNMCFGSWAMRSWSVSGQTPTQKHYNFHMP
jgi:hypothetical protein